MLNLEELVFKVNTKELVDAVTDLQNLGKAVSDLGTKSATINTKVNKTTAEVKTQAKAVKEATEETNKSTAALQRQQDILSFMTQGFSKGQSSVLAYAKAAGAATSEITELGKVLDRQRTLMGTDPFDKSVGAMKALRNEYTVLREVNRLYNADLNLSKNQMNELAREKLRLIEKLKIEGKSFTDVKNALRDLNIAYIQNANAENTLDANMRRRQKTVQDTAKANEYLAKEMERVNRMLNSTESITSTTNNKLIRFEQELKRSGMTAAQQTVALEKYKKALLDIQQAGGNRQVDYLSRALGPQITDIFVGLSTGQSPLMVLLQQGGQLRDQFALAGVAGAEMGNMLTTAAKSMVTSVKDIAMAVGQLMVNAIKGAGMAILDFFVAPFKLAKAAMIDFIYNGNAFEAQMGRLQAAASGFARTAGILGGILGGALLVALYQLSSAQDDFVRALYQSGASLDMNKEKAQQFALSMEGMGVSSTKAMQALTEIAKAGGFTQESLQGIITSAVSMEKYAGVAIEKTVESYKKLQDKPSEALIELAKNTGYLTAEQLKQIKSFEDVGDKVTAAAMAMKAFSDIQSQIAANIQANLSPLERAFIDMKAAVVGVWHEFKTWAAESEALAVSLKGLGWIVQAAALGFKVFKAILSGATWPELRDSLSKDAEALRNYFDETKSGVTGLDSATREYNANAVRGYQNQLKLTEELKDKLDPQKMAKGAFVAAKMQEVLSKTGASFENPAQMQKAIAKYTQEWVDGQKKGNKEVNELERYMKRIKESVRDVSNETANLGKQEVEITKAAKLRADLMDDDLWGKVPKAIQQQLLDELNLLDVKEKQFKQQEKHQKLVEEEWKKTIERQKESDKLYFDISDNLAKQSEALQESGKDLEFQYSLLGKSDDEVRSMTREYERQNKLRKAFLDYEKTLADIRNASPADQESLRLQAERQYADKVRQINSETALQAAQDYEKAFKDIQSVLSDIISTALFEGGKAGQKKLKDILKSSFQNFLLNVVINPIVKGGMNSLLGVATGGGSNSANTIGSMIGEGFNNYLTNTAIGTVLTSSAGYAAAIGGGSIAAGSQAAMLAAQTSGFGVAGTAMTAQAAGGTAGAFGSAFSSIASAAPYIAAALAVVSLLSGLDDSGTLHTGGIGSFSSALGSQSAQSSSALSGYSGTAFNLDAFSKETAQTGADIAKVVVGILDTSAKTFGQEAGYYAAVGFADDTSKDGAWGQLVVKLGDKMLTDWGSVAGDKWPGRTFADGEAGRKEFEQAVATDLRDILVTQMPAWADEMLMKLGDTVSMDQLGAVMTEISKVQETFNQFGSILPNFANLADEAKKSLIDMAGGIDNLSAAVATYYDKFYSEEEKAANATANLVKEFQKLGISMPSSIKEFRKLVEAQDLNTESGRKMYATLIGISGSFYEVNKEAETVADTLDNSLDSAFSALESAVKREQDMISKRISAIESTRNALSKLFDLLSNATRELYGSVSSTKSGMVSSARQFITNAVATAQSGGGLPDADKLGEAIGTVRTGISDTLYSTRFEQERDTLMLAGELSVLQGFADEQLSNADLQLKELKDQSEQMDLMLGSYKVQIDLAKNLDVSVLSVADAIRQMEQTLADILDPTGAKRGKPQATVSGVMGSSGSAYRSGPTTDSYSMTASAADIFGGNLMNSVTNRTAYEQAQVYLNATSATGLGSADAAAAAMAAAGATPDQIAQVQNTAAQYQQYVASTGGPPSSGSAFLDAIGASNPYSWMNLPSYDVGTNYVPRDMVAQLHEGEAVVPKRYNPAANGDSEDSAAATDLAGLRAELQAIALNTDKTRRLLERVTQDGNSLLVTDTATL